MGALNSFWQVFLDKAYLKMANCRLVNMTASRRISVRLKDDQLARLEKVCEETGNDVSQLVRQALDAFMSTKSDMELNSGGPRRRSSPPAGIIPLTTAYLAYGNGDPRKELKALFVQLLAISFVLKDSYPRTKGIGEIYEALLPLVGISEWTSV
jgi:predicted DNA-binding protein